jgi:spore maturation protein CgeB
VDRSRIIPRREEPGVPQNDRPAQDAMRIAIFGLTVTSSWGNGHATLWRSLCRALARRGHRVVFLEHNVAYYAWHRDLESSEDYEILLYEDWPETEPRARELLNSVDAAIVTSYCPDARAAADLILGSKVPLRVFYDLDSPVTLERLRAKGSVEYIPPYGLEPFDLVLSYAGGRALEELRLRLGARRVAPLYGSVDPEIHQPVASNPRYDADLSYLGTYAADRQPTLDQLFIQPARRSPAKRFVIGGAQYPYDFPWMENIWFVRHLPPAEHPAFYCSSRLTLSVTRAAMVEMGYCPSGRLFEAAACETPVLSDSWHGLDEFFEPGREILVAATAAEVLEALSMPRDELRRIGSAARERVLAEHTADHRSQELIHLLEATA